MLGRFTAEDAEGRGENKGQEECASRGASDPESESV